jgi:hypothetical protein
MVNLQRSNGANDMPIWGFVRGSNCLHDLSPQAYIPPRYVGKDWAAPIVAGIILPPLFCCLIILALMAIWNLDPSTLSGLIIAMIVFSPFAMILVGIVIWRLDNRTNSDKTDATK